MNSEDEQTGSKYLRTIKSFVLRAGRLTEGQAKAIEVLGPQYVLTYQNEVLDWSKTFPSHTSPRKKILEIGFGMGESTAKIAQHRPEDDFLAIEVHQPGVGALLKLIGEQGIENLRLVQHDAVEVVQHMIGLEELDGVHIFFPDPWHKKRHHKRRLVQAGFIHELALRIKSGGYIHMATDWQDYAIQMMEVLRAEPLFKNTGTLADGYALKPEYRPTTKFETRGLRLGHGVWDLVFEKN